MWRNAMRVTQHQHPGIFFNIALRHNEISPDLAFSCHFTCRTRLGWAMLVFQVVGMIANIAPPVLTLLILSGRFIASLFRKQQPADRFADAVWEVMARDPSIMARRYADRWLYRVHGRGLGGRTPQYRTNQAQTVLPFSFKRMGSVVASPLLRMRSRQRSQKEDHLPVQPASTVEDDGQAPPPLPALPVLQPAGGVQQAPPPSQP